MRSFIIAILFVFLIASNIYAENWICSDENGKVIYVNQGDCKSLGICSEFNNQGIRPGCFEATKEEYDKARQPYVKVDNNIVNGSKVVNLSDEEKTVIITSENSKASEKSNKQASLIGSIKQKTGLTDEEIDFLLNP